MSDPITNAVIKPSATTNFGVDHSDLTDAERAAGPCAETATVAQATALPSQRALATVNAPVRASLTLPDVTPRRLGTTSEPRVSDAEVRRDLFRDADNVARGLRLNDPDLSTEAVTNARDQWVARSVVRARIARKDLPRVPVTFNPNIMLLAVGHENVAGDPLLPLAARVKAEMVRTFTTQFVSEAAARKYVEHIAASVSRETTGWQSQVDALRNESYYYAVAEQQ